VDLVCLLYMGFPFCKCLKKIADRKLSMSTADTNARNRLSTVRRCTTRNTLRATHPPHKQNVLRNGSKVYFELKRGTSDRAEERARLCDSRRDGYNRTEGARTYGRDDFDRAERARIYDREERDRTNRTRLYEREERDRTNKSRLYEREGVEKADKARLVESDESDGVDKPRLDECDDTEKAGFYERDGATKARLYEPDRIKRARFYEQDDREKARFYERDESARREKGRPDHTLKTDTAPLVQSDESENTEKAKLCQVNGDDKDSPRLLQKKHCLLDSSVDSTREDSGVTDMTGLCEMKSEDGSPTDRVRLCEPTDSDDCVEGTGV
ncbi:hypothetical protein BaRGS_00007373, partial [Batillaria attramentaria]